MRESGGVGSSGGQQLRGFVEEWWEEIAPIRAAIDAHPFLRGLQDGTLERDLFVGYMAQDALYLDVYAKALAAAAAQAASAPETVFWATSARDAILVEQELHASHVLRSLGAVEPSPTTTAYTNHLLALAASGSYPALIAGLLPCFWIYEDVGTRLKARIDAGGSLADHPYGDWIAQYGDPTFAEATRQARELVNRTANAVGAADRHRMWHAFLMASRYEWMFWDAANRAESWPV